MTRFGSRLWALAVALALSCTGSEGPSDSETHFLSGCADGCGTLSCICGVCSVACSDTCDPIARGATCFPSDESAVLTCDAAETAPARFCDLECQDDGDCLALGANRACVAGRCRPPGYDAPAPSEVDAAPPTTSSGGEPGDAGPRSPFVFDAGPIPIEIR